MTKLIVGEGAGICNECVDYCVDLLVVDHAEEKQDTLKNIDPVKLKEHLGGKPFIEQPSVQLIDGSWDVMLEDVYFWRQLKEAGFEIEAYLSSKIKHLPRDIDRKIKLRQQGVFTL